MYFGNVSNFFYKNKAWLLKQPKFSIGANKNNNIMKIGKNYYSLDTVTGKLKLIIPKFNSPKKILSVVEKNNSNFSENKNEKKENLPEIFNYIKSENNEDKRDRCNSDIKSKMSISYSLKNKNIDLNNNSTFENIETNISKNENFKDLILRNNTENSLDRKDRIRNSSFKIKNISKLNNNYLSKIENEINRYKLKIQKYKKLENNKNKDNKILSKKSIKRLLEKRQDKAEEMNSNITTTNYSNIKSNNKSNINSFSVNKIDIKDYKDNKDNKINRINIQCLDIGQTMAIDLNKNDFEKKLFPDDFSLRIKKGDSSYLKTIKEQVFKDRIINNLKKHYQFYEDSKNKREFLKIPKINLKNNVILIKNEIFPPKESLSHKLYFHYVNKQRQKDNLIYGLDYPLLHIKKE